MNSKHTSALPATCIFVNCAATNDVIISHLGLMLFALVAGSYAHWGSWSLTDRVKLLRPKVHIFGHVHNSHGIVRQDGTVYINAAQDLSPQPIFFDIWV